MAKHVFENILYIINIIESNFEVIRIVLESDNIQCMTWYESKGNHELGKYISFAHEVGFGNTNMMTELQQTPSYPDINK